jgi:hypothetical protein
VKKTLILVVLLAVLVRPAISDWIEPNPEFVFARLAVSNRGDWWRYWLDYWPNRPPWRHDHPEADEFLVALLHELTGVRASESYKIVRLDSKDIFKYPFLYLSEPGFLELNSEEIKNLGEYIRRGGFIMADDFRGKGFLDGGPEELEVLRHYLKQAVPERELFQLDVTHPIFHSFYDIDSLKMTAPYAGLPSPPSFWGMNDEKGNLQLIANYNNDVGDFWKYLDHGDKPLADSSRAVRLGVNYVIYAMTH